jgi:selenocysteine lyase/cysteine desulfurase
MKRLGIVGTLRASFSVYSTALDVQRLADGVAGILGELQSG